MSDLATETLEFTYTLNAAEQAHVMALVERRTPGARLWRWVGLPFLAVPLVAALAFGWPLHSLWPYLLVLGLAGALSLLLRPLRRWQAGRLLAEMPHLQQVTYRFGESGIRLSTGVTTTEIAWDGMQEAIETSDMFLLFLGRRFAYYVPKRVVGSRAADFRTLLRAHLGPRATGLGAA
jgi:hypothetical protein